MLKLGTARHKEVLDGIDSLSNIGCFGLSELGYGNNAVEMETTATYDAGKQPIRARYFGHVTGHQPIIDQYLVTTCSLLDTDEIVVHTPSVKAQKYWITNGAVHANHMVVFAQLMVGGENNGIHGVLVPIRDEQGNPLPGKRARCLRS